MSTDDDMNDEIKPTIFGKAMRKSGDFWRLTLKAKTKRADVEIRRLDVTERIGTAYRFEASIIVNAANPSYQKWDSKLACVTWLERQLTLKGIKA